MLERSWVIFNSIIAVSVPLPALKLCKTLCNWRLERRRVSISASTTFHRVSSRPMSCVLVVPFGIRTGIVHPNSCGISPVRHMCCTMYTRHIHCSIHGGGLRLLPGVSLPPPLFKVLRVEVRVSAHPLWAELAYRYLHLLLWWDLFIHLVRVHMCC